MKKITFLLLLSVNSFGQLTPLTVEKIMRDPKWIGVAPSNINWSDDGKTIYFNWNPDNNAGDSLYSITPLNSVPLKVNPSTRRMLPSFSGELNRTRTKKVYEKNGDLFLLDIPFNKITQITNTLERE